MTLSLAETTPPPAADARLFHENRMPDITDLLRALPIDVQRAAADAALDATDTSVKRIEASTPEMSWVSYAPFIGKVVTLVAGGWLLKQGVDTSAWTGNDWVLAIGAVVTGAGAAWAWLGRKWAAWREHQIALASAAASASASAAAGKPVEVPVQPPPAKA